MHPLLFHNLLLPSSPVVLPLLNTLAISRPLHPLYQYNQGLLLLYPDLYDTVCHHRSYPDQQTIPPANTIILPQKYSLIGYPNVSPIAFTIHTHIHLSAFLCIPLSS